MSTLRFSQPTSDWDGTKRTGDPERTQRYFMWDSVWKLLTNYLQPHSTLSLDEVIERAAPFWDDTYIDSRATVIHMVVMELAEQMPHDHPSHERLAGFMIAMSKSEKWLPYSSIRYHKSLKSIQDLYWSVLERGFYNHPMDPDICLAYGKDVTRYVNLQVFLALIGFADDTASASASTRRFARYARWALDGATLEAEEHADDDLAPTRDAWVMGGAQCVLVRSQPIWDRVCRARAAGMELESLSSRTGWLARWRVRGRRRDLIAARECDFTWSRWQSWEDGFRAAARNPIYSDECRDVARRAADVMARRREESESADAAAAGTAS